MTGSGVVYARTLADQVYTFDFGAGLVKDNLLLVDRETNSVWSQLANQAISGEMEGTSLRSLPSMQTTWKFWLDRHPDTRVMIQPDQPDGRPYYYHDFVPGKRGGKRPSQHDASTLGLGYANEKGAAYYSFRELAKSRLPVQQEVGGVPIQIHFDSDGLTAWATDSEGTLLVTVLVYEHSWQDFFPDSELFRAQE